MTPLEFLLSHLWQSTVFGLIVLAVLFAGRRLGAGTRRALAWIALAKFSIPAAWLAPLPAAWSRLLPSGAAPGGAALAAGRTWVIAPLNVPLELFSNLFGAEAAGQPHGFWRTHGTALVLASFAISALLFVWWVFRSLRMRRAILATAAPVSAGMQAAVAAASSRVGLLSAPVCRATPDRQGPCVLGVFAPVVALPAALETTLAPGEIEAILLHEFIHLKRRDNGWSALQALILSLFWYHPLVWVLSRTIRAETEKSCDERVLTITADPPAYVRGILKAARYSLWMPQVGLAGAASLPVVSRIKNIQAFRVRRNRPWVQGLTIAGGCLLASLSGSAGAMTAAGGLTAPDGASEPPDSSAVAAPHGPAITPATRAAFKKIKPLLAAKDYDGVLAVLAALEPTVKPDSYDLSVILDTRAKVLWQGKNSPQLSIAPWEQLLAMVERHPDYLTPADRINHYKYLAQTYYLVASNPNFKNPALKEQYFDHAIAEMDRWQMETPELHQEDLVFYTSLLFQKAVETPGKLDIKYLGLTVAQIDRVFRLYPEPKIPFYLLRVAIAEKESDFKKAAEYLEVLVTKRPTDEHYWKQLYSTYGNLSASDSESPADREKYSALVIKTRDRAQAFGIKL